MVVTKPSLKLVRTDSEEPVEVNATREVRARVEQLYQQHCPALRGYLVRLLPGRPDEVEVIVQETCVKLLRQPNLDHLELNPQAYIFTVATNLVRDSARYHTRRWSEYHYRLDENELPSHDPSPSHRAEWMQSLERIKLALNRLKPTTRKVFLLSRFEGMTYPEVARTLGISTRSVERHMSKAMNHLRSLLDE